MRYFEFCTFKNYENVIISQWQWLLIKHGIYSKWFPHAEQHSWQITYHLESITSYFSFFFFFRVKQLVNRTTTHFWVCVRKWVPHRGFVGNYIRLFDSGQNFAGFWPAITPQRLSQPNNVSMAVHNIRAHTHTHAHLNPYNNDGCCIVRHLCSRTCALVRVCVCVSQFVKCRISVIFWTSNTHSSVYNNISYAHEPRAGCRYAVYSDRESFPAIPAWYPFFGPLKMHPYVHGLKFFCNRNGRPCHGVLHGREG